MILALLPFFLFLLANSFLIIPMPKKTKFYAVAVGKQTGIFPTWEECQTHVKGFSGARFKSFKTEAEATAFLRQHGGGGDSNPSLADLPVHSVSRPIEASRRIDEPDSISGSKRKSQVSVGASTESLSKRPKTDKYKRSLRIQITFDGGARGNPGVGWSRGCRHPAGHDGPTRQCLFSKSGTHSRIRRL